MTNREKFLAKIANMEDLELAKLFCTMTECGDCPVKDCKRYNDVVEWFHKEADRDDNSRDFDF